MQDCGIAGYLYFRFNEIPIGKWVLVCLVSGLCDAISFMNLVIILLPSLLLFTNNFSRTIIKTSFPYFHILCTPSMYECCIFRGRCCVLPALYIHAIAFAFGFDVCSRKCIYILYMRVYVCVQTQQIPTQILAQCLLGCSFEF